MSVAPYAGAWIEIDIIGVDDEGMPSLPMRERGLKYEHGKKDNGTA